jgi:methyl-accepting chemotaxis protein
MKKFNASIFVKIWLSISVLFLGYIVSMVMIQITGGTLKDRLNTISDSLFPAAKLSQEALSTYEKQIKYYQDAVMMGEADLVNNTNSEAEKVQSDLNKILDLKNLNTGRVDEIQGILQT